jgi:hypothetical protein
LSWSFPPCRIQSYFQFQNESLNIIIGTEKENCNSHAGSIRALGKQLEIFAIILLRNSFKSFAGVEEPITWDGMSGHMLPLLSEAFGALAIILLLAVFYRMHYRLPIPENSEQRQSFINTAK